MLGLIGESGCGKTLTALSILGLQPATARVSGQIRFAQRDLLALRPGDRRRHLGHDIAMIYQDALSSLNPAMTIRAQLKQFTRRGGTRTPAELLELVNLDPERTLRAYPHELSGGQRQRVLIAMALSRDPKLIVADEPTTALDVTVQAQILDLMRELNARGSAMVLITHDMGVVSQTADRVLVMYGGRAAEEGPRRAVFPGPRHPYTWGLLDSVPRVGGARLRRLPTIAGVPVSPGAVPEGCAFAPRCRLRHDRCEERPVLSAGSGDAAHRDACWLPPDDRAGLRFTARPGEGERLTKEAAS